MKKNNFHGKKLAVVIPAYRVRREIVRVVESLQEFADLICVVDDACPEKSGKVVEETFSPQLVQVIYNVHNLGVGGAVKKGYEFCIKENADVVVKIDGDGQMDVTLIPHLIKPIFEGEADYTKGNRFFSLASMKLMPKMRLFGNAVLSFLSKMASGYWNIADPNNGFTAVDVRTLKALNLGKISNRYFFESDMLFQLNLLRAKVTDIPMMARYGSETSSLSLLKASWEFPLKHLRNFVKRIFINYFVRDISLATLHFLAGFVSFSFGLTYGLLNYMASQELGSETKPGTLIMFAVTTLIGLQLLIVFFNSDQQNIPKRAISGDLKHFDKN